MGKQTRLIGIDVGNNRVGLAQSDLLRLIASPIGTFSRKEIFIKLGEIVSEEAVEKFIVGWPLTLKGKEGDAVHMVRSFLGELRKLFPGIEVVTIDERFTSSMAQKVVLQSGISRKRRRDKGNIDTIAAAIILQDYLDRQNRNS